MLNIIPRPYLILARVLLFVGSNALTGWRFYQTGYAIADAKHATALAKAQVATMRAAEEAGRNEAARLAAEAKADAKAKALEDLAYADPVRSACGISVDRVRRLQSR